MTIGMFEDSRFQNKNSNRKRSKKRLDAIKIVAKNIGES